MTSQQQARLVRLLTKVAMAHEYRTELQTTQRTADLIERHVGGNSSTQIGEAGTSGQ